MPKKLTAQEYRRGDIPFAGWGELSLVDQESGNIYKVPVIDVSCVEILKPSKCDYYIKMLEFLRDNFTDEEIQDYNDWSYARFNSMLSNRSPEEIYNTEKNRILTKEGKSNE